MAGTILLDGIWEFRFLPGVSHDSEEAAKTETTEFMPVPGCFDALKKYFGRLGCGVYRRNVECGGTVRLIIGGIGLAARVFWDGREIGTCLYPWSSETFVFNAGAPGFHELRIAVDNQRNDDPSALFHNFYDFYGYGGLYDSVTLEELPEHYFERIEAIPLDIESGKVRFRVFSAGKLPAKYKLHVFFDHAAGPACEIEADGPLCETTLSVPDFMIWSPETPNLHSVTVRSPSHSISTEFGIRRIETNGGKLLLNGKPLRLIGYNRHEAHPDFGPATPLQVMIDDLTMIRDQGCNFIRGCHYPQKEAFLSLCDRMGMLVWDESLGWGNSEVHLTNPEFIRKQCEQTGRMVRRSLNHPSVILWGFLNEADTSVKAAREIVTKLCKTIREADSSRPITFASNRCTKDVCLDLVDVISFNTYPGWYGGLEKPDSIDMVEPELARLAEFASRPEYRDKPMIISEIGAAAIIGDHSGMRWSEEYQARLLETVFRFLRNHPRCSGLLIWQFSNAKSYISEGGCLTRPRGFNNKGLVDEYRRPKLAWHRITELLRAEPVRETK